MASRRINRSAKIRARNLPRVMMETVNDDSHMLNPEKDIVLGVYGLEDWITSTVLRNRFEEQTNTTQLDGTWLTDAGFELSAWAKDNFSSYIFFAANSVSGFNKDRTALTKVMYGRGKIEVEIRGDYSAAQAQYTYFDSNFRKAENLIEWVYNGRGDSTSVPLNYRPAIRSAYPWIDGSYETINDYIDEYMNSEASILILIGAPGTGKTTFIKNLIHRSKANAKVAYDPKVMSEDGFFAGFIGDDTRFLIMEDADEFLAPRAEGNTMMHKFLNVSDGLISAADKKLVFSTNLPDVRDIDEALMRPGRCFDVLQFRELTRAEAEAVLAEIGNTQPLRDGKSFTLAQLFSSQPSGTFVRRKLGFV